MSAGDFQGSYDPAKIVIVFGDVSVHGFTDGDFVTAKYDGPQYFKILGIDGEVCRSRNPSKAGSVEITLLSSSPANDELSDILQNIQINGDTIAVPMSINDLSGRSLLTASKSWIKESPDLVFGKEISDRKWVIDCADLEIFYGGSDSNSLFDAAANFITSAF